MSPHRSGRFWAITVAAIVGIAAGLALGAWQLSRAAQKNTLHAAMSERRVLPMLDGRSLAVAATGAGAITDGLVWRTVRLKGEWIAGATVFLDNRQMKGKPGFDVLTPLRIEGSDSVVAVQRGWVARNFVERERLPVIQTPAGVVEVTGVIAPPPPKLYTFAGPETGAIRQNLDLVEFRARTGLPLLTGLSVRQTGASADGLLRDWADPVSGVEKHYGYAFQWFTLSALIAILYVWFQFIAPRRKPTRA